MLTTAPYKTITQIVYHHHLFYEIITISRFMKHYETKQNHNVLFKKKILCIPRPFLRETHHIQKAGINCIQGSPIRLTCLINSFEESKEQARKWLYCPFFVFHTCLYLSCFNCIPCNFRTKTNRPAFKLHGCVLFPLSPGTCEVHCCAA